MYQKFGVKKFLGLYTRIYDMYLQIFTEISRFLYLNSAQAPGSCCQEVCEDVHRVLSTTNPISVI